MKILLHGRVDLLEKFGGDTRLIKNLSQVLAEKGINYEINALNKILPSKVSILHLFGIMRIHDLYPLFVRARNNRLPIVVTPIYEDLSYLDIYGRFGLERYLARILSTDKKELLKGILRGLKDRRQLKDALYQLKTPYTQQQQTLLQGSNAILASTEKEKELLLKKFNLTESKIHIIPFGIDRSKGDAKKFIEKYGIKKFILCVGRIEPKKNQLGILKALNNIKIPVLFVGDLNPYHKSYCNQFLEEIQRNKDMQYLGNLERKMLLSGYAAAKVHILGSWFEAPGIVNFEAALNNCNIVTTANGYGEEYFGKDAFYCRPDDPLSIRKSVLKAYKLPFNKQLKDRILKNYTIDKVAPLIINSYNEAINNQ